MNSTVDQPETDSPRHPRRVLITANPFSGSRGNRRHVEQLVGALEQRGLIPEMMWEKDGLGPLVGTKGFGERYRCVVAAGGDGTLSHVINQRPGAPVMMFPLGTENLFAREFGYSRDADAMADAILACQTRDIDLGRCGDILFSIVASAGIDAEVARRLAEWRHAHAKGLKRVRRISYLPRLLEAMVRYKFPPMNVDADGRQIEGALALVFNIPQYGFRLPFAPHADPASGALEYVVFQKPGRAALIRYMSALILRRHLKLKDVYHGRANSIRIDCQTPVPLEIDGDCHGACPVDIHTEPGALRIIRMSGD
jgi:diacylglycerol kinase family enzyme